MAKVERTGPPKVGERNGLTTLQQRFSFRGVSHVKLAKVLWTRPLVGDGSILGHMADEGQDTPKGRHLVFPSQYRREKDIPHEPDIFAQVATVLLPAAYLNFYLTGALVGDAPFDLEETRRLFAAMVTARTYDHKATAMQKQGRLATYAPFEGQEACQIGSVAASSSSSAISSISS